MKNRIARKIGFTLVEVILGSIIIAGFVTSTVYTAGEIGKAKRDMLAKRDINAWANVQTVMAAEGVKAPSDNTDVWGVGTSDLGQLYSSTTGDNDTFSVPSEGKNLAADTVETKGQLGDSVCVNAFLVNLNYNATSGVTLAPRANLATLGLSLMDRTTYSTTEVGYGGADGKNSETSNGEIDSADATSDPMVKPDGIFTFVLNVAVAKYDASGNLVVLPGTSASIDALTELNWSSSTSSPLFYVLLKAGSGELGTSSVKISGYSLSSVSNIDADYDVTYAVTLADIQNDITVSDSSSPTCSFTLVATGADKTTTTLTDSKTVSISINKVTPTVALYRYNTNSSTLTTASSLSAVTLYDVCQPTTTVYSSGYNAFRIYVSALNGKAISSVANASYVLSYLYLYSYIDNVVSGTTTSYTLLSGSTAATSSDSTGYYTTISMPVGDFLSGASSYTWRVTNKGDNVSTSSIPYGALFVTSSVSNALSISKTALPVVAFSPSSGNTISSATGITAYANTTLMSTGAYDSAYPLYYIYYNYSTSSSPSTPTLLSYNGVINYYTGSVNLGSTLTDGTTVYVTAIALANSTYSLFLYNASGSQTSGTYTYDSDVYKVLAYVNILDNINGYVQGSIQVRDACSFNANGSAAVGFELRLNYEPKFTLNGTLKSNFKYYSTTSGSSYYASSTDILTAVQNNSSKCQIISTSKTYTLDNQSFYTPTSSSSSYTIALNISPISIETSISPKDPEGAYTSDYSSCSTDYTVENGKTLTLTAGTTYYYNSLTVRNGGTVTVSGSGTAIVYVKTFSEAAGTIGNSSSVSSLNVYTLNDITLKGKFYGKLHCGTYVKTSTTSTATSDGYLHNYTAGKVIMDGGSVLAGKIWCYELNMNGSCQLLIQ
jgi:hypothetical protein